MEATVCLVTADDLLLDAAVGWCAVAGIEPEVVVDTVAAARAWRSARIVMVGEDLADALAARSPRRRAGVFVLARDSEPWEEAARLGAERVVLVGSDPVEVVEALRGALDGRTDACVLTVVGACGGAGASTLAAAVARRGVDRGLRTLLVDGSPYGGGLDLVLGAERAEGARWSDLAAARGSFAGASLQAVLPELDGLLLLSADRDGPVPDGDALEAVLAAARRSRDLVVVDLDRVDGALAMAACAASVLTVVLAPEEVRGLAAGRRVLDHLAARCATAAVTRPRSGGVDRLTAEQALGAPVLARLARDRRIPALLDAGRPVTGSRRLRRAADLVLDAVGLEGAR